METISKSKYEFTGNGILYDWWLTGPQGAHFLLFPIKGEHTKKDIAIAKHWIRNNQDPVSIRHEWVDEYQD